MSDCPNCKRLAERLDVAEAKHRSAARHGDDAMRAWSKWFHRARDLEDKLARMRAKYERDLTPTRQSLTAGESATVAYLLGVNEADVRRVGGW